jgi:hypothetical protein
MVKIYKGFLSVVCCLLIALPLMAQQTTPQNQDRTDPTYNSDTNRDTADPNAVQDQDNAQPNRDMEERPSSTNAATDDNSELPETASGLPLLALIGSSSLIGVAIRRWL